MSTIATNHGGQWNALRVISSSRVLSAVAVAVVSLALAVDAPRKSPRFAEVLGCLLVVHIWVSISLIVYRSSHPKYNQVSGRKVLLTFVPLLVSYAFLYTSMNAASRGNDFSGESESRDAGTESDDDPSDRLAGKRSSPAYQTLRSMGDFCYFSMVSMSTVGYGDVAPKSHRAKFFVCSHFLCTFVLAGVLLNRLQ